MWNHRVTRNKALRQQAIASLPDSLNAIFTLLDASKDAGSIYERIIAIATAIVQTPPELAYLRIITPDGNTKYFSNLNSPLSKKMIKDTVQKGITGRAIRTGKVQLINDVRADADYVPLSNDVRSELAVPIVLHGDCQGVINLESPVKDWFIADDVHWITLLANAAAHVESLDLQRATLDIRDISPKRRHNLDQNLDEIIHLFPPKANVMAEVMRLSVDGEQLVTVSLRPDEALALHIRLRKGDGNTGRVIETLLPFVGDVDLMKGDRTHIITTESVLVLPIIDDGKLLGIINLESPQSGTFSQADIQRVHASSSFPAIQLKLKAIIDSTVDENDDIIVDEIINKTKDQIYELDRSNVKGMYLAILTTAARIISTRDCTGGIMLLRDKFTTEVDATPIRYVTVEAKLPNYATDIPEWDIEARASLTRIVVRSKEPINVGNVDIYIQRKEFIANGDAYDKGSEVIVPILTIDREVIGVIDFISAKPQAFIDKDVERLQMLAVAVARAVDQTNQYADNLRLRQMFAYQADIARQLPAAEPLEGANFEELSRDITYITATGKKLIRDVLNIAKQKMRSEYGAVILQEHVAKKENDAKTVEEIRLSPYVIDGGAIAGAKPFWSVDRDIAANTSVTGLTFITGKINVKQRVKIDKEYMPYFPDVQSEIAIPIIDRTQIVGILNLESTESTHFVNEHVIWGKFLADQIATILMTTTLAIKTRRDAIMHILTDKVSEGIGEIQRSELKDSLDLVRSIHSYLLRHICEVSHIPYGCIFLSISAYHADNEFDKDTGCLLMISRYPKGIDDKKRLSLALTQGISGMAFTTGTEQVFNREADIPDEFKNIDETLTYASKSSAAIPFFEAARSIGVLYLDSSEEQAFSADDIVLCRATANLIADVSIAWRLHQEKLQANILRDFEIAILRQQYTTFKEYATDVLQRSQRLTLLSNAWGTLILLRRFPNDILGAIRIEQQHAVKFVGMNIIPQDPPPPTFLFDSNYPILLNEYQLNIATSIIDRAYASKRAQLQPKIISEQLPNIVWKEASSLICVPLIRPREGGDSEQDVFGLFIVATDEEFGLNDADKTVLTLFAQTVTLGIANLTLQQASTNLAQQITHDFGKVIGPLLNYSDAFASALSPGTNTATQFATIRNLIELSNNMIFWFVDLTVRDPLLQNEGIELFSAEELAADLTEMMKTFANVLTGHTVHWDVESSHIYFKGGERRNKYIRSAVFKYIENALKYGRDHDVTVTIRSVTGFIQVAVQNQGKLVPVNERDRIFTIDFRGSNIDGTSAGTGTGLYQVKQIATVLGGSVDYKTSGDTGNIFLLNLPSLPGPTIRRNQ